MANITPEQLNGILEAINRLDTAHRELESRMETLQSVLETTRLMVLSKGEMLLKLQKRLDQIENAHGV